jgi:putative addiction module component (TIGR02574 family)
VRLSFSPCQGTGRGYFPFVILETLPDVNRLTPAEKLLLVSELWDDLAAHPTEIPVSPDQVAELDRRMDAYRLDPGQVTSWEAIQQRILGRTLGGE